MHVNQYSITVIAQEKSMTDLDFKQVRQLFSLRLPNTVPCICHEDNRNFVFPISIHQIPEALFGCGYECSSTH